MLRLGSLLMLLGFVAVLVVEFLKSFGFLGLQCTANVGACSFVRQ